MCVITSSPVAVMPIQADPFSCRKGMSPSASSRLSTVAPVLSWSHCGSIRKEYSCSSAFRFNRSVVVFREDTILKSCKIKYDSRSCR